MSEQKIRQTVYIEKEIVRKLKYLSADENKPMSTIVEEIIREYFLKKS